MTTKLLAAPSWTVDVFSDLVWGPRHPEDGERREVEVFYLVIEGPRGHRYASLRTFTSRAAATRCVPAARRRLARGESPVGSPHWSRTYPAYGSEAYVEQEPEMVALERATDEAGTYYDGGARG